MKRDKPLTTIRMRAKRERSRDDARERGRKTKKGDGERSSTTRRQRNGGGGGLEKKGTCRRVYPHVSRKRGVFPADDGCNNFKPKSEMLFDSCLFSAAPVSSSFLSSTFAPRSRPFLSPFLSFFLLFLRRFLLLLLDLARAPRNRR